MRFNRKITSAMLAAALVSGGGVATIACGSSASASESHPVTQQDEARWAVRWISDPNVTKLVKDGQDVQLIPDTDTTALEHASARLATDVQAVRDHAPDSPYDNKDLDKGLAHIGAAFKALAHGDVNAANRLVSAADKDTSAFDKKLGAKFPASSPKPGTKQAPGQIDPWVQGQIDWAKAHGLM